MLAPPVEFSKVEVGGLLEPEKDALALLSAEEMRVWEVLPLAVEPGGVRVALVHEAGSIARVDRLSHLWGKPVFPQYVSRAVFERSMHSLSSGCSSRAPVSMDDETPIVRYVAWVIEQGICQRASDIHFEPEASGVRLRFRVDGQLKVAPGPDASLWPAILSRIKLLAGLQIDEHRYPQEGGLRTSFEGNDWDVRVSTLPGVFGEGVVLRLLSKWTLPDDVCELGMEEDHVALMGGMLARRDGLILASGPTGSGKSTTIYTLLKQLDALQQKIITVEDPVEYRLEHVSQVPVREAVGLTFAAHLRAMLRQAPDVIMVGEIRDAETAQIALSASMTGHLVLSTLHTLDASSAIVRLLDLGVEPFLLSSALRGVMAQRLVRRLCSHCCSVSSSSLYERQQMQLLGNVIGRLYRPAGCEACYQQGYRGRVGIFECLDVNDSIGGLVDSGAPLHALRSEVRAQGVRSLLMDGLKKVEQGLTSLEEMIGVSAQ